jgi:TolA-binding protein
MTLHEANKNSNRAFNKNLKLALLVSFTTLSCGCASFFSGQGSSVDYAKRIHILERENQRKDRLIEDLRERNLVLETRDKSHSRQVAADIESGEREIPITQIPSDETPPVVPVTSSVVPSVVAPKAPTLAVVEAPVVRDQVAALQPEVASSVQASAQASAQTSTAASGDVGGDQILYSKILETYRRRDAKELSQTLQLLLKSYPDSVFADNALYAAGRLAFENGDLNQARFHMSRVVHDYPKGNKAVSALYALGSIDMRENKVQDARREFMRVREMYPGSPEAARVAMQLKILERKAVN